MSLKKTLLTFFVLLIVGMVPMTSHAATYSGGEEYLLRSGDVVEGNLYVGGAMVAVEGDVQGDLYVGGGEIHISGNVTEDLVAAGGRLDISSDVTEDVRVAGGSITINGHISGELVVAGGYVHLTSSAVVDGDVLVTGGRILINGTVNGSVEAYGGEIEFGGIVEGSVISEAENIVLSKNAVLNGGLAYKSYQEAEIQEGAQIYGQVIYEDLKGGEKVSREANVLALFTVAAAFFTGMWFLVLLITLATALVLYALLKDRVKTAVRHTFRKFWPEVLRGFVLAILLPIAIIISFMSVLGACLGFIALALLGLFVLLAKVGASILAGSLVFRLVTKKYEVNWKTIVVGVLVLGLLRLIPILGGIACAILFLAAFGTLWLQLYNAFTKK